MKTLIIASHPDDEILGCGGTIAKRISQGCKVYVCIVTLGTEPMYSKGYVEKELVEMAKSHNRLGLIHTKYLNFPSALLDTIPQHEINDKLTELVEDIKPDEVFIPHFGDMHSDHRIVAEASMVALRPINHITKRILSYEVLSETDWNTPNYQNAFIPNVYEDISPYIDSKLTAFEEYKSQIKIYPACRSKEGIKALAAHRGMNVGCEYAEGFMLIREISK